MDFMQRLVGKARQKYERNHYQFTKVYILSVWELGETTKARSKQARNTNESGIIDQNNIEQGDCLFTDQFNHTFLVAYL